MKECILPSLKRGDLGLAKNYRSITLTPIAAKIYNALLRNCIEPKIDNILRKNQNGFQRNRSTTSQILTIRQILEGVRSKYLRQQYYLLTLQITKQILLVYGLAKEILLGRRQEEFASSVTAIMMFHRNTKVKVRSLDGDTDYFNIAGVLQGDTLAPYQSSV